MARRLPWVASPSRSEAGSGPTVAYAGILDGRTLWLALDGIEESDVVGLHGAPGRVQVPHQQVEWVSTDSGAPRWSARIPLGELPGDAAATFELRVGQDRAATPPRLDCTPAPEAPTRTPVTSDGPWQFELAPTPAGTLELRRRAAPAVTRVERLGAADDCLWVRYPAPPDGPFLLVLDDAEHAVVRLAAEPHGDTVRAEIEAAALPLHGGRWRLAVGTDTAWRPLVRAWHDLCRPTRSVALPTVYRNDLAGDLRFFWEPDGWLGVVLEDSGTGEPQ